MVRKFLLAVVVICLGTAAGARAEVTFNRDVAPILFANCVSCHRPGEVAPFSLLTYGEASRHAREIAELTQSRAMPPWKAEPGFGEFAGARHISDEQIAVIQAWLKAGKPQGNAADLPPAPHFATGWRLGEPDLVVKMPEAYTVPAEGRDVYRCFVLPLSLSSDVYVTAIDFRPSNPHVVHHSLFYLDTSGRARELDAQDPGPGYARTGGPGFVPSGGLGGWAPGYTPQFLPDGVGRLVKKGSDLVLHTHFHPSGKPEPEQSMVGLYFAKKTPQKLLISVMRGARPIDIAPGDTNYRISNTFTVPSDVELAGIIPHAHLLCTSIKVTATLPDGKQEPLIWIKDWDWDWQEQYLYKQTMKIPAGTRVRMDFTYDNSAGNIHNPSNPPQRVHWGEQTKDEMALVFFQLLVENAPGKSRFAANPGAGAFLRRLFQGAGDGK